MGLRMGRSRGWAGTGAACAIALAALSGCSSLPNSGPSAEAVATRQLGPDQEPRYLAIEIAPATIEALRRRGGGGFSSTFGDRRVSAEPAIGVGDAVTVTIWEAGPGGLFSAAPTSGVAGAVSAGANSATIPEQTVGRDGAITVPYAGRVQAAGRTARAVQKAIEQALEGKAIQPQALVNVTKPVSNAASVGGEVAAGARVPLSVKGDRLLDVLAAAGGVRAPVNETFVELTRGTRTSRIPLITVINDPRENISIHPDDVLTFVRDPQKFIAYGATGTNAEIPFEADGVTLGEALAKAGGLQDDRSDPRGVFVFRWETEAAARALAPDSPLVKPGQRTPVVYRLDLTDPNSLFLQQNFRIANRDVIYVSNSPSTDARKMFAIIGGGFSTIGSAASVANAAATIK